MLTRNTSVPKNIEQYNCNLYVAMPKLWWDNTIKTLVLQVLSQPAETCTGQEKVCELALLKNSCTLERKNTCAFPEI